MKRVRIPKVGEKFNFFDDGKISLSRVHIAEVKQILTYGEAKEMKVSVMCDTGLETTEMSIVERWKQEIEDSTPGLKCNFAEDTDVFIICSIPTFDDYDIVFARTEGGYFRSMDIQCFWQTGVLDISWEASRSLISFIEESNYPADPKDYMLIPQ